MAMGTQTLPEGMLTRVRRGDVDIEVYGHFTKGVTVNFSVRDGPRFTHLFGPGQWTDLLVCVEHAAHAMGYAR